MFPARTPLFYLQKEPKTYKFHMMKKSPTNDENNYYPNIFEISSV